MNAARDEESFALFYDATCAAAYRLELCRWRSPEAAAEGLRRRYRTAWLRLDEQARSGLSPLAWLLSLPDPAAQPRRSQQVLAS